MGHKLAFNSESFIGHFFPTIITDFFLPNTSFLFVEVSEKFYSSLLKTESFELFFKALINTFNKSLNQIFNILSLLETIQMTLEGVFFILNEVGFENHLNLQQFVLRGLFMRTRPHTLQLTNELLLRVLGLPCRMVELILRYTPSSWFIDKRLWLFYRFLINPFLFRLGIAIIVDILRFTLVFINTIKSMFLDNLFEFIFNYVPTWWQSRSLLTFDVPALESGIQDEAFQLIETYGVDVVSVKQWCHREIHLSLQHRASLMDKLTRIVMDLS